MPMAARVSDFTNHGSPLGAGPGSADVRIGNRPAWRALPAGPVGAAVERAASAVGSIMSASLLNPAGAAAQLGQVQSTFAKAASDAAAQGNPAAPASASAALTTLAATNAKLSAAWAAASVAPGGEPAASQAYTKGIQAAVAGAAAAVFSAIAAMTDLHDCPAPCGAAVHGPGMVTQGAARVRINGLPAARTGDNVVEACGGSDPIAAGCVTVNIG